jgi:desulfoferrodoxin (superoxide reductase-like protein)
MAAATATQGAHFTQMIYVKNNANNKILALKEFTEKDLEAKLSLSLPDDAVDLTVYAYCNLHGLWSARVLERKIESIEKAGVLTVASPGSWAGKEAGHAPRVTVDPTGTKVTVFAKHEMVPAGGAKPEHHIDLLYLRDAKTKALLGVAELAPNGEAKAEFTVPAGTTQVVAYAKCNLHGVWSQVANVAPAVVRNETTEASIKTLENGAVYTAANEGPFVGKAATHVPTMTVTGTTVQVTVPHEMKVANRRVQPPVAAHYVTTIYLRDQNDTVIAQAALAPPRNAQATASFTLPPGVSLVTAYAVCNQHGAWASKIKSAL